MTVFLIEISVLFLMIDQLVEKLASFGHKIASNNAINEKSLFVDSVFILFLFYGILLWSSLLFPLIPTTT